MKKYTITATATRENSAKKEAQFSIRTISKKEAIKEAHKHFSGGPWSRKDYKITGVEIDG